MCAQDALLPGHGHRQEGRRIEIGTDLRPTAEAEVVEVGGRTDRLHASSATPAPYVRFHSTIIRHTDENHLPPS